MAHSISVMVHTPAHSGVGNALTYLSEAPLPPGTLVRVPLGKRETLGIVWDDTPEAVDTDKLKPIIAVLDGIAPLDAHWRQLVNFSAQYYQRSAGEIAYAALPNALRELDAAQWQRRLKAVAKTAANAAAQVGHQAKKRPDGGDEADPLNTTDTAHLTPAAALAPARQLEELSSEQTTALQRIAQERGPFLLWGTTGSGKTEVYLQAAQALLAQEPQAQVLVMVPEINLTPQLQARFAERFGSAHLVSLHSGLTPAQRLRHWLAAHTGQARIMLGTRMAVFASMPHLRLIVVDEEHDPSYKQQEGARYSARDLAVYRAQLTGAKVILGSATPSLESWHHSRPADANAPAGRYVRLTMHHRIGHAPLPVVRRVDMNHQPRHTVFSAPLLDAMRERIQRGEQVLILLNRRGYAPVLHCHDCGWKSQCPHCSAYRVFHKRDRSLRCHHCGFAQPVPRACPGCGNPDIRSVGRGTEQLEEHLAECLADVRRSDGSPLHIARIDADSTRLKGELEKQLAQVHAGDVDVLVGTQMIAKGHDFRRVTLVAALNPDGALFSSDFRAPERLFALLMQAAGRAGRAGRLTAEQPEATLSPTCEMWVQTYHPTHPLFEALKQHDYPSFAQAQLQERAQAGLPPLSFQALVRAEARSQEDAQAFLQAARDAGEAVSERLGVFVYPPVPMHIQRVANIERAQMLLECESRKALQQFLAQWHPQLHDLRRTHKAVVRWAIDVDPLQI
jgi:primosomal protein N' (replication factor Y)